MALAFGGRALTMTDFDCDVLVVGGGINGAGIARDLAGRGWRVTLVERDDLASHTSSASTKLIHGGLRYLEHREFGLVRKALQERERLLRSAPHIMRPLRFVMPHDAGIRPAWMIRLGLFLYDHLARREWLPGSAAVDLARSPLGRPLHERFLHGFEYSDGWVDDARLVALCAVDAAERGASILTRTSCVWAQRAPHGWHVLLRQPEGDIKAVRARALVNAAGPWAETFLREVAHNDHSQGLPTRGLRLVKGSHIVVPRCFEHDHAYIFQSPDKRIIFAIPYEQHFMLIGTTDIEVPAQALGQCRIEQAEVDYLCEQASRYFLKPITQDQVVHSFAGIRPLIDDAHAAASAVTRDYVLDCDKLAGAPLLSVWGGKITTFRKLAEQAADQMGGMLGEKRPAWTADACLPGGDLRPWVRPGTSPQGDLAGFVNSLLKRYPWLPILLTQRLARAYGGRVMGLLQGARSLEDLGREITPGLHEAELRYLVGHEWARTAEDVLWRRSKLGLCCTAQHELALAQWLSGHGVLTGRAA
ncbi:glycerol-3-phosphate dehydrogenase [Aquabacterium sp.]|uniref:glycerol-3-phosphate dehydrogenase n=1 Tax=Aquabacterium sp. TaxID=1872578 RepID=UPI0040377432